MEPAQEAARTFRLSCDSLSNLDPANTGNSVRRPDHGVRGALRKLDHQAQRRISRVIDSLALTPRPHGSQKLASEDDLYRVRTGDYRIIYTIRDRRLIVLVVAIGHRRDVYRL